MEDLTTLFTDSSDWSTSSESNGIPVVQDEWEEHPVIVLWREWNGSKKVEKANFDFQAHKDKMSSFINGIVEEPSCLDVFVTGRRRKCTCMHELMGKLEGDKLERVVEALLKFGTKTKFERNVMVGEWIRYADAHQEKAGPKVFKVYLLPGGNDLICQHALARVIGLKSFAWRNLCSKVREGKSLDHGLTGKASNNLKATSHDWVDEFLTRLQEQGCPRATRLVRYINSEGKLVQETRDDDVDVIDLPSSCTKLGLYKSFLAERGWQFLFDPKNRIIDKRPIEGMEQDPTDPEDLPSITTFLTHWEKHFPKMKIQKQAADICDECFVFANQVRYKQRLTGKLGRVALLEKSEDGSIPQGAIKESEGNGLASEELILAAAEHVDKQKKQREFFHLLKQQARLSKDKGKVIRVKTFFADFAQNMGVPNFATEKLVRLTICHR